jgi:hypothetical protein
MLSDLNFKPKGQLDPFLLSKLDVKTINFFDFPKLPQQMNKYLLRSKGI